ncbi:acyltransferase [Serpentinimonas barnesii]|uniref:acyltransferase n=1 Tax=Serpentinimonas barnesii TaxID=1458427 RepID=UPI0011EA7190|nr:acyltransferase [Serpentinimonas barnesii]MBT9159430.1 putative acetyltransferase [Chloroflexota bacterium]
MRGQNEIKDEIIKAIKEVWESKDFSLCDTERNTRLRSAIVERLVSQVMTDDERANFLGLPEGCRIRESAKVIARDKLVCGKYVWIGEGAVLDASGGLEIGDHTSIGLGVMVWSHSSHLANLAMKNKSGSPLIQRKPTHIGRGCFIGGPAVIYSGVTIGDRCLIQPMSVVTTDIPSYSVVSGSPAKVIKSLSEDVIDRMVRAAILNCSGQSLDIQQQ